MKFGWKEIALLVLPVTASAYVAYSYLKEPEIDYSTWETIEQSFSDNLYGEYREAFSDKSSSYSFLTPDEIKEVAKCEAGIRVGALKEGCSLAEARELGKHEGDQDYFKRKIAQADKCTGTLIQLISYNETQMGLRECVDRIIKNPKQKSEPKIQKIREE